MLYKNFNVIAAENILHDIQFLRNNYYYFLGRTYPWNEADTPPTELGNSYSDQMLVKTDSLFFKKINPTDVSLMINRYDWESGTVYDKWDDRVDMIDKPFFVVAYDSITSKYNVYKCLDNNLDSESTVKPTGTSETVLECADGYIWKFMYCITESMMEAFASVTKIPVFISMTSHFYNKGSISDIVILDGGSGYTEADVIVITGDGHDAIATPVIDNGSIIGITMNSTGSGYTYATAKVYSETGSSCSLRVVLNTSSYNTEQAIVEQTVVYGAIYCINIVEGGTYYSNNTTVTISGDGHNATATLTIQNGRITKVTMTNYGYGYTYANIIVTDPQEDLRPGNAVDFSGYVIIPPDGGHGRNAIRELMGTEIVVSSGIPLMTFSNANDFRQYGIIKNPTNITSGKFSDISQELNAYTVLLNTIAGLSADMVLTSNSTTDTTSKYRVVFVNDVTKEVILKQLSKNSLNPSALISSVGLSYYVKSISTYPVIDKYSGDLLYVANHSPFATVSSQNITLKTLIKF